MGGGPRNTGHFPSNPRLRGLEPRARGLRQLGAVVAGHGREGADGPCALCPSVGPGARGPWGWARSRCLVSASRGRRESWPASAELDSFTQWASCLMTAPFDRGTKAMTRSLAVLSPQQIKEQFPQRRVLKIALHWSHPCQPRPTRDGRAACTAPSSPWGLAGGHGLWVRAPGCGGEHWMGAGDAVRVGPQSPSHTGFPGCTGAGRLLRPEQHVVPAGSMRGSRGRPQQVAAVHTEGPGSVAGSQGV